MICATSFQFCGQQRYIDSPLEGAGPVDVCNSFFNSAKSTDARSLLEYLDELANWLCTLIHRVVEAIDRGNCETGADRRYDVVHVVRMRRDPTVSEVEGYRVLQAGKSPTKLDQRDHAASG